MHGSFQSTVEKFTATNYTKTRTTNISMHSAELDEFTQENFNNSQQY